MFMGSVSGGTIKDHLTFNRKWTADSTNRRCYQGGIQEDLESSPRKFPA